MEHPSTMTRLATQIRRVRFAALVALGVAYVLLPASIAAAWLRPALSIGAVVVFLWFPALETFVRNFREGYRDRSATGNVSRD